MVFYRRAGFTLLDDFVSLLLVELSRTGRSHWLQREWALFPKQVPVRAADPYQQPQQDDEEPHPSGSLFSQQQQIWALASSWGYLYHTEGQRSGAKGQGWKCDTFCLLSLWEAVKIKRWNTHFSGDCDAQIVKMMPQHLGKRLPLSTPAVLQTEK